MRQMARRLQDERGIALIFTLVTMTALAASVTTVILVSSSSGRTAHRATADQQAYTLAEAGIDSAMSLLHGMKADGTTPVNALDATALPPSASPQHDDYPAGCTTDCIGYVEWGGDLDTVNQQWTIVSTGVVTNPTGPGSAPVERKLTAVSQVVPSLTQPVNNQIWNYIYSWGHDSTTTCDVVIGGSNNTSLAAPLYVEGNLCIGNNGVIVGGDDGANLVNVVVQGKVRFDGPKSAIGTSSSPVNEAHLYGGCGTSLTNVHTCSLTKDPIHVSGAFDTGLETVGDGPTVDTETYYESANPGPLHPCSAGTALNPPTFDNDGTLNGNMPTFDVTPLTSYTCEGYDGVGNKVGELSWNASTKTLTVQGVVYFDGNVTFESGSYDGHGTIYTTGYATLNGDMCGKVSGSTCDFRTDGGGWDPNDEMLILVAGGTNASGQGIVFGATNIDWQGGLYSTGNITFENNAHVEGPLIAKTVDFENNVTAQPFPTITNIPLGAPGNPNVYADATAPQVTG